MHLNYNDNPINMAELYTTSYPSDTSRLPAYPNVPIDYASYVADDDDRFFPFLAPFLLGGITGAALTAPFFGRPWGWGGVPCCSPIWPVPTPYPMPYPTPYPAAAPAYTTPYAMPAGQSVSFTQNSFGI